MKTLTAQQKIYASKTSAAILSHMATGKTIQEAYDAVLGAGAFARLASDLYDAFNAQVTS